MTKGYERVKNWRDRTKGYLVAGFGGKCACCGIKGHQIIYDFHHIDPKLKEFAISSNKNKAWNKLVQEVQKCVMLCAICHRLYHAKELLIPENALKFDHKLSGYINRNELRKKLSFDNCPVCGNIKRNKNVTCSLTCSKIIKQKVNWDNIDLIAKYNSIKNYEAIGRELGVSGNTIKKRYKKLISG